MRVRIREDARLQHLVGRVPDARHDVGRRQPRLLDLGEIVLRVAVQFQRADVDQRIVAMWPDLRQVERVVPVLVRIGLRHDLHADAPARIVARLDRVEQVALVGFAVAADHIVRLDVGPVLDALHRLEVELHPEALAVLVPERIGVRAVAVDVAIALRQAAIRHQDRHLVQAFGRERPEVPHRGGRAQIGLRVAFLRVDEVGELHGIADEEHRRVVADHVPVPVLGVEAQGEAAHVALRIRRAALTGDRREPQEGLALVADLAEDLGAGIVGNVVVDGQRAVGAGALGVHRALGDALAVLVRQLLEQAEVLHEDRPARTRRLGVLVVGYRSTARRGHGGLGHRTLSFGRVLKNAPGIAPSVPAAQA